MMIYTLNLFIVVTIAYLSDLKSLQKYTLNKKILQNIVFLQLWLLSGFRYMVGTDFYNYKVYFENIDYYKYKNSPFEGGYYLLNKLVHLFSNNSQLIFLIISFITIYLINITLSKYSSKYWISIFLFITLHFYYESFNIMRQYVAIAIVFYSIEFIYKENLKKYLICVLIATMFHKTAIFMMPFYWLLRMKFKLKTYVIGVVMSPIIAIMIPKIIHVISLFIPKYAYYVQYGVSGASANSAIIISLVILIFMLANIDTFISSDPKNLIYINAIFFAIILGITSYSNIVLYRLMTYLYILSILAIPNVLNSITIKMRVVMCMGMILFLMVYTNNQIKNNNGGIIPYKYNLEL